MRCGRCSRRGADARITARVMDLVERDILDRESERRRRTEIAAMRGGEDAQSYPVESGVAGATPQASAAPVSSREAQARDAVQEALEARRRTGEPIPLNYADLVSWHGGLSAIHLAAREGHSATVATLLDGGVDIDLPSAADATTPMLIAAINGYFDLVLELLGRGADPTLASDAGATPLYAVLNVHWAPKARHPQPLAYEQQETGYLELMRALLDAGADVNARLNRTLWFTTYNRDLLGVDRTGATPFWRAAHATDVPAMQLLLEYGADPRLATVRVPSRRFSGDDGETDPSGLPPVPVGGPAVHPIHAAAGVGYGQGFAGNSHRHAPDGWMPTMRFLVEELGADVNARDHNGYTPVHHAAARGDNEMILYLVERGADVTAVARSGQTTVDMANGPVQRIQPFVETIVLLERLGAREQSSVRELLTVAGSAGDHGFQDAVEYLIRACPGPALAEQGLRMVAYQRVRGIGRPEEGESPAAGVSDISGGAPHHLSKGLIAASHTRRRAASGAPRILEAAGRRGRLSWWTGRAPARRERGMRWKRQRVRRGGW